MPESPCSNRVASKLDLQQIPMFTSLIFGFPLICFLIFRLCTKKLNLNKYHLFIIAQCVNEGLFTILRFAHFLLSLNACNINEIPYDIVNFISGISTDLTAVSTSLLAIYWKSICKTQKYIDKALYSLAIIPNTYNWVYIVHWYYIYWTYGFGSPEMNYRIFYNYNLFFFLPVMSACFISLLIVVFLDKSKFSPHTAKCYWKMTISLFLQALFLLLVAGLKFVSDMIDFALHDSNAYLDRLKYLGHMPNVTVEVEAEIHKLFDEELARNWKLYLWMLFLHFDVPKIVPFVKAVLTWWSIRGLFEKKKPKSDRVFEARLNSDESSAPPQNPT